MEHRLKRPARWACSPEDVLSRRREEGAPRRHVPLVAIEAIIGAGKSTLLEQVKAHFGDAVVVVHEPVDVWTDVDGHNLLERYYKDQRRWGFSFQTFALFSRLQAVRTALAKVTPATRAVVMERSWLSDRLCFASLLHDDASMDGLEEAMHRKIFEWGLQNDSWPRIDGFVYLDVDLHVAQVRPQAAEARQCLPWCLRVFLFIPSNAPGRSQHEPRPCPSRLVCFRTLGTATGGQARP